MAPQNNKPIKQRKYLWLQIKQLEGEFLSTHKPYFYDNNWEKKQ